jgi:pyruvate formate lyase activating enzyme
MTITGIVTNIQRFSIHDGPGIRTTVFLKGCNLRCFWCHNPETLSPKPELQLFLERCIGCGECLRRCERGGHVMVDGARQYRRDLCVGCGRCAETCYAEALVLVGQEKTVDEVVEEVLRDRPFYETSNGGVTLSGGEPLLQLEFSRAILECCKAEGLHTAIETALNAPWERVAALLSATDLVMLDIKHMDSDKHRACTGVPNERILENVLRLGQEPQPVIVRTPVVPGVNDMPEEIAAIARFVAQIPNLMYYELLPFHPMARGKYSSLDLDYGAKDLKTPPRELMDRLTAAAAEVGVPARHS